MKSEQFKINKFKDVSNWNIWKSHMKIIMNAVRIYDLVIDKSKTSLTKPSNENKEHARKRYNVDYSIHKMANNKSQKYIIVSVNK